MTEKFKVFQKNMEAVDEIDNELRQLDKIRTRNEQTYQRQLELLQLQQNHEVAALISEFNESLEEINNEINNLNFRREQHIRSAHASWIPKQEPQPQEQNTPEAVEQKDQPQEQDAVEAVEQDLSTDAEDGIEEKIEEITEETVTADETVETV